MKIKFSVLVFLIAATSTTYFSVRADAHMECPTDNPLPGGPSRIELCPHPFHDDDVQNLDPRNSDEWQQLQVLIEDAETAIQEVDKAVACYDDMTQCARNALAPVLEKLLPEHVEALIDRNFGHSTNKFQILDELRSEYQIVILGSEFSHEEYVRASSAAVGSYVSGGGAGAAYLQDLSGRQYRALSGNAEQAFESYLQSNQQIAQTALQDFQSQLSPERLFGMMTAVAVTGEQPDLRFDLSVSDTRPTIEVKWVTFGRSERFFNETIPLPNTHNIAVVIRGLPELSSSSPQQPSHGAGVIPPDNSSFITSLQITSSNSSGDRCPSSMIQIPKDLNASVGGDYIYLCFSKGGTESPITDLKITTSGDSGNRCGAGWEFYPQDLNAGAGGDYIYLCSRRDGQNPIREIDFTIHQNSGNRCPTNWGFIDQDLNKGAGGKYIYTCFAK